jgi:c-di-GMP-binding flagellar brake protein YcgR
MEATSIFSPTKRLILSLPEAQSDISFQPLVIACDTTHITLELPNGWTRFLTLIPGNQVHLATIQKDGIYTLSGLVEAINDHTLPSITVAHNNQAERIQRRTFFRIEHDEPITVSWVQTPEGKRVGSCSGRLVDVSAGGIRILVSEAWSPQTRFSIQHLFSHSEGHQALGPFTCLVCWCRADNQGKYHVGASFEFEHPQEQEGIAKLIHQIQLEQIRHLGPNPPSRE